MTPNSRPVMPEMDPDYVNVHLVPLAEELQHCGGGIVIRKDDVKRLNLMVGDIVTLKITKS